MKHTTTRRSLLRTALGLAAAGALAMGAAAPMAQAGMNSAHLMGASAETREIAQDVAALTLFHELGLSSQQKKQLVEVLAPARSAMESIEATRASNDKALAKALEAARAELLKSGEISASTQDRLDELRQAQQSLRSKTRETLQPTRDAVAGVLTPEQLATIQDFHMSDVFEDENDDNDPTLRRLDAMRSMTPEQIDSRAARITQRATANGQDGQARAEEFRAKVAEMQAVPDAEWPAARARYAEQAEAMGMGRGDHRGHGGAHDGRGGAHKGRPGGHGNRAAALLLLNDAFYEALTR